MVSSSSKVAASLRTTRPLFVTCRLIKVGCGKIQGNLQLLLRSKVARQSCSVYVGLYKTTLQSYTSSFRISSLSRGFVTWCPLLSPTQAEIGFSRAHQQVHFRLRRIYTASIGIKFNVRTMTGLAPPFSTTIEL